MKLEVEMYVRTKNDEIGKIRVIIDGLVFINTNQYYSTVSKASHNIIDLIEAGDYVNGLVITRICEDTETKKKYINLYGSISEWEEEDIKSIITKEQFESMSYKIGD